MAIEIWTNDPKWKNIDLKDPKNIKKYIDEQFEEMCKFFGKEKIRGRKQ